MGKQVRRRNLGFDSYQPFFNYNSRNSFFTPSKKAKTPSETKPIGGTRSPIKPLAEEIKSKATYGSKSENTFGRFFDKDRKGQFMPYSDLVSEIMGLKWDPNWKTAGYQDLINPYFIYHPATQLMLLRLSSIFDPFRYLQAGNLPLLINLIAWMKKLFENSVYQVMLTDPINIQEDRSSKTGVSPVSKFEFVKKRIDHFLEAYKSLYNYEKRGKTDDKKGIRQKLISIALSQMGTTYGMATEQVIDPNKPEQRIGYTRLQEYYAVAKNNPKYLQAGSNEAESIRIRKGAEFTDDQIKSWCGAFALWAHRMTGLETGSWNGEKFRGFSEIGGFNKVDSNPKSRESTRTNQDGHRLRLHENFSFIRPGDVAIMAHKSHHFIVIEVKPQRPNQSLEDIELVTIEGNARPAGKNHHGQILFHNRHRKLGEVDTFYRHKDL